MATFAKPGFSVKAYQSLRPTYPESFYKFLESKFDAQPNLAVDLGCGTGQATIALAPIAKQVIGVDASDVMIEQAKESDHPENVSFQVGSDKTLRAQFEPESIDLITVAEALHWFDIPEFYKTAASLLRKGGVLAAWAYCDQEVIGHPEISPIMLKYSYDAKYMGNYWDEGRKQLQTLFVNSAPPTSLFADVEYRQNLGLNQSKPGAEPLELVKKSTLGQFIEYFRSYSSYHNWMEKHPEATRETDVVSQMKKEIIEVSGLTDESEVTVKWNTVYMTGRKP